MNARLPRILTVALLLGAVVLTAAAPAQAGTLGAGARAPLLKLELADLAPKVKFSAGGALSATQASIRITANITVAGKTFSVKVLDMGLKKSKKSVTVKRTIGKLKVTLKLSWSGTRTITVSGSARYLKFKIPVPKLKIRL